MERKTTKEIRMFKNRTNISKNSNSVHYIIKQSNKSKNSKRGIKWGGGSQWVIQHINLISSVIFRHI